jgi:taurine transport system substrate-binding protein
MACGFGADSMARMYEAGEPLMTAEQKEEAGIISFDVVSVTEKFAQENPDLLRTFLEVTHTANESFTGSDEELEIIANDAGLDVETTRAQMADFVFPSAEDQLNKYFNEEGMATQAIAVVGAAFATTERPALEDYAAAVDTSYLK